MNNLPTLKDVWSFLKDYKKIIVGTMIGCLILYALGMVYSIYSSSKVEEGESIPLEENMDSSQEVLSSQEIKVLQEDLVSFSFYIENDSAEQFTNYNLMKQLLISPETLAYIKETSDKEIKPNPYHAVNMSLDHSTYVLTLSIGTGNYNDNKAIAQAYYDGIVNEEIPFFNSNKNVYMISEPARTNTGEVIPIDGESTNAEDDGSISIVTIIGLAIAVLIGSFVLGVIVSLIYAMTRKVITDPFTYEQKDNDTILNLSPLIKNINDESSTDIIEHAIRHPHKNTKAILAQHSLPKNINNKISTSFLSLGEYDVTSSNMNSTYASVFNDLTEVNPDLSIEEVIIISEKNKTTKDWYSRQRLLLENYNVDIKVIQI